MQQFGDMRIPGTLARRALAGRGIPAGKTPEGEAVSEAPDRRTPALPIDPCGILKRLAQTIRLMRLDHGDAHLYRNGCDALVRQAIDASKWSGLRPALAQIMRLVEQGDYHWALIELRTISQPEWHTC